VKGLLGKAYSLDIKLLLRWYRVPVNWNSPLRYILFLGDGLFWSPLGVGIFASGILTGSALLLEAGAACTVTILISGLTFILPKSRINRMRPFASRRVAEASGGEVECRDRIFGRKENESFPSGHAFWTSAGMVLATWYFGLFAFLVTAPLALSMIFFRPNLGVHFPSDTVAGFFMGALTAAASILFISLVPRFSEKILLFFHGPAAFAGWLFLALLLFSVFMTWRRHV